MEAEANSFIWKCLLGADMMELKDSSVSLVRDVWVQVVSRRKRRAEAEVQKAVSRLQHQAVVGSVQTGWAGLGRGGSHPTVWSRPAR